MLFAKLSRALFPISAFVYLIGLGFTSSAQSISLTRNLSWQGTGGVTLTGTFTGDDADSDGVIRGTTVAGANELSAFTITITDPSNTSSATTYNLSDLLVLGNYNDSTGFLFNYKISNGLVLQSTDYNTPNTALSIGDGNGYLLESAATGLSLLDTINSNNDSGGTLTATAVPFEFEGSASILTIGALWGANRWRKNRIKK